MSGEFRHRPVMGDEIVAAFGTVPPGIVIDATVGGGGHAGLLLRSRPDLRIVGIDRDPAALAAAAEALGGFAGRVVLRHGRFDALTTIMTDLADPTIDPWAEGWTETRSGGWTWPQVQPPTNDLDAADVPGTVHVSGVLFDLGVSSPQLDRAERGFS